MDDLAKELEEKTTKKLYGLLDDLVDEDIIRGVRAFVGLLCNCEEPSLAQLRDTLESHDTLL